jgi:hypothetical protein
MEGLLNYAYIQTNSLNLFDELGHALGITLVEFPGNPATQCGYQTGPTVSAEGGGATTNPKDFSECAGILGDKQPGINYGTNPSGLFGNLPPYDPSVCPDGSTVPAICDPNGTAHKAGLSAASPNQPQQQQQQQQLPPAQQKKLDQILKGVNPNKAKGDTEKKLKDLLNLPQVPNLPDVTQGLNPSGTSSTGSTTQDLLNFLLGQ